MSITNNIKTASDRSGFYLGSIILIYYFQLFRLKFCIFSALYGYKIYVFLES
ncbi:hypothetical protein J2T04_002847 [Chryseobacterium lathyri]|uniref:Uncharacterized protein n=1 Tax=Chryseobacterium lathyri TaxID=395933 RepID=A0ABT9SNE1_9FLAO|nr:hypothetical protein [Chryseobacterium lathyri]